MVYSTPSGASHTTAPTGLITLLCSSKGGWHVTDTTVACTYQTQFSNALVAGSAFQNQAKPPDGGGNVDADLGAPHAEGPRHLGKDDVVADLDSDGESVYVENRTLAGYRQPSPSVRRPPALH